MITLVVHRDRFDAASVEIAGDAYRHLFRSRRAAVGDTVRLVDGRGRARWSTVRDITRHRARLVPGSPAPSHESRRRVVVLVAAPKPQRLAWMVEKLTEVGVAAVRLLRTERAPRRPGAGTLERLQRVAVSAVEQCHRAWVPEVSGPHEFRELAELLAGPPGERWVLDREGSPAAQWVAGRSARGLGGGTETAPEPATSASLLIGPEGGWSALELAELDALGCRRLSLGARTLRVETAAVLAGGLLLLDPSL